MAPLTSQNLRTNVSALAQKLDSTNIDYAIMKSAGTYLLGVDPNRVKTLNINGRGVKLFIPEWILRENILSQNQSQGGIKEAADIRDITNRIPLAVPGRQELDFNRSHDCKRFAMSRRWGKRDRSPPAP
ncbi:conserved hypothetical protein [Histoplasma capsulatum var. duboisii H88]|uniref:Uncharacterized protein n=1 Tax=Ajellomyces capsulatus (strain H88) TaxID=544711 RepID=F0UAG2_AJEC8|nr:conserved hypothetical protein [Histoplasma capsulatum var. duboisii H88]